MRDVIKRTNRKLNSTIKRISQGMEIVLPRRRHLLTRDGDGTPELVVFFLLGLSSLVWFVITLGFLGILPGDGSRLHLGFHFLTSCGVELVLISAIFAKEKLVIEKETLRIQETIFGKIIVEGPWKYLIRDINHLRLSSQASSQQGRILFDYGPQMVGFGRMIDRDDAVIVLKAVSDILKFHCHTVERIVFSSSLLASIDPYMTIQNPDVSELTVPFVHLTQILIASETYDFHQVERFLTYAVNSIGQDYLKRYVDVHIYGDSEKLHANLRNSLTNLCRHVHVHKGEEIRIPMST